MAFHVPEQYRVRNGKLASDSSFGNFGAFVVPLGNGIKANVIASDDEGWEHVSITIRDKNRTPTWQEMGIIKDIFWDETDCCVQYHPPKSEYVNNHPYCLHIWRSKDQSLPMPPSIFVGVVGLNYEESKRIAKNYIHDSTI